MKNVANVATCPDCKASKRIEWVTCRRCDGTGEVSLPSLGLGETRGACPSCGSAKEFGYAPTKGRGGYWGVRCGCDANA